MARKRKVNRPSGLPFIWPSILRSRSESRPKLPVGFEWMASEARRLSEHVDRSYDGPLARYIRLSAVPKFGTILSSLDDAALEESLQRLDKIPALFAFYDIDETDPSRWEKLAHALACKHVPGMRVVRDVGRPREVTAEVRRRFYRAFIREKSIQSARRRSKQNNAQPHLAAKDESVCEALCKDTAFKEDVPELAKRKPKALQNLICDIRRDRCESWLRRQLHRKCHGRRITTLLAPEKD